jgi:flagellar biosynthesis protein FliR
MIADANLLHALSPLALAFALALARIGGVVMLLPGVGETVVPATLQAGFAVALTLLLMPKQRFVGWPTEGPCAHG